MRGLLFYINSVFRRGYRLSTVCSSSGLPAHAVKFEQRHTRLHQSQDFRRFCASRQRSDNTKQQLDLVSNNRSFGGQQKVYEHDRSVATCNTMASFEGVKVGHEFLPN